MTDHRRSIQVSRASVDPEAGTFDAVLFTDGEASDGHILNIAGGSIPERMPLFVNHMADPREQLGSLHYVRSTDHEVHVRGEIMVEGDSPEAEVRRDLLAKMAAGHVSAMSGRWDAEPGAVTPRSNLPKDHPAFVSAKEDSRKRFGAYFDAWTAMEGSIVGLPADQAAKMRDEATSEPVREFWARQVQVEVPAEKAPSAEAKLAAFGAQVRELIAGGIPAEALADELPLTAQEAEPVEREAIHEDIEDHERQLGNLADRLTALEEAVATPQAEDTEREEVRSVDPEGEAPPPEKWSPKELLEALSAELGTARLEMRNESRELLRRAQGKIR